MASVQRVRRQIETRVRKVAQTLGENSNYPLTEFVLKQMKGLSEADYLLVRGPAPDPPGPFAVKARAGRWTLYQARPR